MNENEVNASLQDMASSERTAASQSFINGPIPWLSLLVAASAILVRHLSRGDLSVLILFAFAYGLGLLLAHFILGSKGFNTAFGIRTFTFTYSTNVVLAILLEAYYYSEYGRAFLWNPHAAGDDTIPLIQYGSTILKNSTTGLNDDLKFHIVGVSIARDLIAGSNESAKLLKYFSYVGYPWLVGTVLYVSNFFGDMSPLAPRVVNCMFGGLLVVAIFSLATSTYGLAIGTRAAKVASLFPTLTFYSANTFRDIIVSFLIVLSTLLFARLLQTDSRHKSSATLLTLAISGVSLLFLRSPTLYTLLIAYALYVSVYGGGAIKRLALGFLIASLFAGIVLNSTSFSNQTLDYLGKQGGSWNESRIAGSSKESLAVNYIYKAPTYISIPLSTIYMVFMPVPPFNNLSFPAILEGTGAFIWYFFVPFWIVGLWKGLRNRETALSAITCIVLFMSVAYVGGALRHKTQFMALGFIHVSYAAEFFKGKTLSICLGTALVLSVLAGIYGVLKL